MARICILTSVHTPFDTRIFQKQARSLAAAGHEVTLVAPYERDEVVDGVRIRAIAPSTSRLSRMLLGPPRVLREALRAAADVYHFHDPELLPVGLLLKAWGRKVVYDVHENVPQDIRDKGYLPRAIAGPLAWLVGSFERAASRAFDLIIAVDDAIAARFRGHPNVLVIRNFPSRAAFAGVAPAPAEQDGATSHARLEAVYVGGLSPERGVIAMVDALDRVSPRLDLRLHIYGSFWPEAFAHEVSALPGFRRVRFHGQVPYREIPGRIAEAQVGVVCWPPMSLFVGNAGPTKLFEYMASGVPVVASDFPSWREIVEGNDCGLCVDATDPDAIAAALQWLADHPERRAEMGRNGRRVVLERYNWEAEADRLLSAYAKLGERPVPAGRMIAQ